MKFTPGCARPFKDPRVWDLCAAEKVLRRTVEDARILRDLAQTMHEIGEHEGARLLETEAADADAFAAECEKAVAILTGVLQREARP